MTEDLVFNLDTKVLTINYWEVYKFYEDSNFVAIKVVAHTIELKISGITFNICLNGKQWWFIMLLLLKVDFKELLLRIMIHSLIFL